MTKAKVKVLRGTPASLGYTFPAEWERQSATWFSWPRPEGISFPGKHHTVPANIAAIIRQIIPRQLVHINVPNENYQRIVQQQLIAGGVPKAAFATRRIRFHFIPTNESWCRDHGPAFVIRRRGGTGSSLPVAKAPRKAIVDWGFNAWGGKYPPFDADDAVPTRIAEALGPRIAGVFYPKHRGTPVIMEGGAVEFNGRGTVLTTESCLLNKNRNPGLSKRQLEHYLKAYYGQRHVCWLGDGIAGDDTDGHIDDLARFLDPSTIAVALERDPRDENYGVLQENLRRCRDLRDQDGRPFDIVTLPMPGVIEHAGQRLPATYLNFLFINGALLMPTFRNRRADREAWWVLTEHLHPRKVIGIDCTELIWGLGAIHCLTQQEPA